MVAVAVVIKIKVMGFICHYSNSRGEIRNDAAFQVNCCLSPLNKVFNNQRHD